MAWFSSHATTFFSVRWIGRRLALTGHYTKCLKELCILFNKTPAPQSYNKLRLDVFWILIPAFINHVSTLLPIQYARAGNGSMGHGSNGSWKSDGSHGSWVTRCWPMTHQFLTLWLSLYIVTMIIIVSVCDACAIVHVTDEVPISRSHSSSC